MDGSCDRKTECRRWKSGGGGGRVMLQQDGRGEERVQPLASASERTGGVTRRKTYQPVGIHMRRNICLASVRPDMAQPRVSERHMSAKNMLSLPSVGADYSPANVTNMGEEDCPDRGRIRGRGAGMSRKEDIVSGIRYWRGCSEIRVGAASRI